MNKKVGELNNNIISVSNLIKRYNTFVAVNDISFDIKAGEIFAFLGPNGAGKSTTIKMLTTILKPSSGKILMGGFDVNTNANDVRKVFGIVFQDPSVDDELTAYENMKYHAVLYGVQDDLIEPRIKMLLELVGLWDRKNDLVKRFSGGMKRRLEIARGLLHRPKILFLDEPTVGLDPQTRNMIWDYIRDLNKKEGITIFFTTHYMDEAERYAQRIAVIDKGKIIVSGTSSELKKKTRTKTLEDAFIKLTGKDIHHEDSNAQMDDMRLRHKIMVRR